MKVGSFYFVGEIMKRLIVWMMAVIITTTLLPALASTNKSPDDALTAKTLKKTHRMTFPFIENYGQVENKDVSFYAKIFNGTLFVEKDGSLTYSLSFRNKGCVVIKEFITNKQIKPKGLEPSSTRINYFKGNDRSKWRSNISSYESIFLEEIYKGINLTLKAYENNVEKLFTILPGTNPAKIKVKLLGAKELKINQDRELEVITDHGAVKFSKPIAYQKIGLEKRHVEVDYSINAVDSYTFSIGQYDKKIPLVIDPLLASTFIGGGRNDQGTTIAIDGNGYVYVAGITSSPDYPTTSAAYNENYTGTYNENESGTFDVFISKFDNNLSSLLASTFIGGSQNDYSANLALNGGENVYITGHTKSSDYPTTPGVYAESFSSSTNAFISKFDNNLSLLLASTFYADGKYVPRETFSNSIAIDENENVYIAGKCRLMSDKAFISKFDSNLSSLLANKSIDLGGFGGSTFTSIALDKSGNVCVTGDTIKGSGSHDFPTTPGVYDESYNGGADAFVIKYDSNLENFKSTVIGGFYDETGYAIATDEYESIYITGHTYSSKYPTTINAHKQHYNGILSMPNIFISKFDKNLTTLMASTFIDPGKSYSMAIDEIGDVYVTGTGNVPSLFFAYNSCVLISKIDSSLSTLLGSNCIGKSISAERLSGFEGYSIALTGDGNIYITGVVSSPPVYPDYPVTSGAFDESYNGGWNDGFVTKLDVDEGKTCLLAELYDKASEEINITKNFRDTVLSQTPEGRALIKLYYSWSPAIVKAMEEDEEFKEEVKQMLDSVLPMIEKVVE